MHASPAPPPQTARPAPWRALVSALLIALGGASFATAAPRITDCRLGLAGEYKLGLWAPATVTIEDAADLRVELVAPDCDGVATIYSATAGATDGEQSIELYFRVGRSGAPVEARLVDGQRVVTTKTISPGTINGGEEVQEGRSATSRLVAEVDGSVEGGGIKKTLLSNATRTKDRRPTYIAVLGAADALPLNRIGYEAFECLWINLHETSGLAALTSGSERLAALNGWIAGGGRLVLAGPAIEDLRKRSSGLAELLPGEFAGLTTLRDASPIETYAQSSKPVAAGRRLAIPVARLINVTGQVEAFAGAKPEELPLIIRQRCGFGEVVFVGVDLTEAPLANWPAVGDLVARIANLKSGGASIRDRSGSSQLMTAGYTDLSGAVQDSLGESFVGVSTTPMLVVVAAAIAYLALIGPVDYFLLKRVIGRMEATWLTFPAIVLLFGGGAYWLASQRGGVEPRLNRLELVDIESASSQARSVVWAQAYSPEASRFDLSLEPRWPNNAPVAGAESYLSWLGMPGRGLGGLDTPATAT
ncbi:MAG: hypothetical protein AAF589_09155, partial [Planctomycetota bacterium]